MFVFDTITVDADADVDAEDDVCMLVLVNESIEHSNDDKNQTNAFLWHQITSSTFMGNHN